MTRYFIAGGAGFIGSHLAHILLGEEKDASVVIYDNFSSGNLWHLDGLQDDGRMTIVHGEIRDIKELQRAMQGTEVVYHFASNPDIAKAASQPDIDFWEGTYLTNNIVEAMRLNNIKKLFYASGSGIYGDIGSREAFEDHAPMLPISTYGASKLSCEALICSYCYMFDMKAVAFRFANVVGPHQTHGVGYDFIKKLLKNPTELAILGDGSQSKSYIYVSDVIRAMRLLQKNSPAGFSYFNVSTEDHITVSDIANIVLDVMGLKNVNLRFSGGDRGWKGDIPIVRLSSAKIRQLGWKNQYTTKEALFHSVTSMFDDAKLNRFGWQGDTSLPGKV